MIKALKKTWDVMYPLLFYYALMLITMTVAQWFFGSDNEHYVLCRLISTVITIPFMIPFYRTELAFIGKKSEFPKFSLRSALAAVFIVGCLGIALNNIISMSPLVEMSAAYQEANEAFYGSTFMLEIISSALLTPILEELVFRGIIFTNLRRDLPKYYAIAASAIIFAIVHWNIVQFIYALLIGLVLAYLVEKSGQLYTAMLGHITANFIAVVRTETGFLEWSVMGDALSWVFSVVILIAGFFAILIYDYKMRE